MDKSWQVTLMYVITHLGLIFFLYPGDIISSTEESHWIPIVLGFIVHILAISIYMKGLGFLGKKDIISLYLGVGKGAALLFLLPMFVYFLMIYIIMVRSYAEIMTIIFLTGTPLWAIMVLFLIITTYIASKGVEAIFRTGVLIGLLCLPLILLIFSASFQNVDWRYVFPLVDDFSFITNHSYLKSFFAFGGGFLFLGFVQPYFFYKQSKILIAAFVLLPFFIFSVYIPVLTFGQATASTFHFPFIVTLDAINITWLMFDRITMFFLLSLITFTMLFLSTILWKTMRIVNRCMPSFKPVYLLISISLFVFIVCLMIPSWEVVEKLFWWNTYLRFYILIAVPLSTYYFAARAKRKVIYEADD
ncbi:GerAB/ArcD/ProY family transporter [Paenibacillus solisilvae]|uniref:GerAB/ArcD/ProY family transporter n=1 Tax=Paenibacillus solisilvae TaxID=2486751 RepID=A0ABW0VX26_9BACL